MRSPRLFVSGRAHPGNVVEVGGERLHVRADGAFFGLVPLLPDLKELVITCRDEAGHTARLAWPLTVSPTEHFLLALGDASSGLGAHLSELPHDDAWRGDGLFIAGRAALLARGRIAGAVLGRELRYLVHADTARRDRLEPYFQQMIDPARDYVIFADGTDDVLLSSTRGPLYVMVEIDRGKVGYGAFNADLRGLHLFRYERTFDGAHADVEVPWSDGLETRLRAFATADNRGLVRRHDELRATGGSLYYLSHKGLVRGSERVDVVVRELGTGMELGRARLERDRDYRVDDALGRLTTMGPVPSVVDALFAIGAHQPFAGRAIQQGHEVWLVVGYEADAVRASGDMAYGARIEQRIGAWLDVGAGVAREGRPGGGAAGDYLVWGSHARVRASPSSWAAVEVSGTTAREGLARSSTDGGLRYDELSRTPEATRGGWGLFAAAEADVGELAARPPEELDLKLRGHWQLLQPGFRVAGLAHEEGSEKWGGEVLWRPHEAGRAQLRYDGGAFLLSGQTADRASAVRRLARHRVLGRYEHAMSRGVMIHGEATLGDQADAVLGGVPALPPLRAVLSPLADGAARAVGGLSVGARWRLLPALTLLASQEALFGGDDRVLGRGGLARVRSEAGAELALTDATRLRALGTLRWSGDHAARLGLVTPVEGGGQAYLEERLERGGPNARLVRASVVGVEADLGGGRAFGEYRLDGGVGGRTNRAVLGLSRALELGDGVRAVLAWERSAALASEAVGRGARDVVSGGLQVLAWDRLKLHGLFEARWDRDRAGEAAAEVLQALSRVNADLRLGDGVAMIGLLDHALSQDLATRAVLVEDLLATVGLVWRPRERDDLILTLRWTRTAERREVASLTGAALLTAVEEALEPVAPAQDATVTTGDLLSLGGVFELPWRLQLAEKLVWRRARARRSGGQEAAASTADTALWLTRLAYHVVAGLDLAAELRLVASLATRDLTRPGGLLEASWRLADQARLGLGWSLGVDPSFEPEVGRTDLRSGVFLRMSGLY